MHMQVGVVELQLQSATCERNLCSDSVVLQSAEEREWFAHEYETLWAEEVDKESRLKYAELMLKSQVAQHNQSSSTQHWRSLCTFVA